jgi:hypothetical protein
VCRCPGAPIFGRIRAKGEAREVQKHDIREPAQPVQMSRVRPQTLGPCAETGEVAHKKEGVGVANCQNREP